MKKDKPITDEEMKIINEVLQEIEKVLRTKLMVKDRCLLIGAMIKAIKKTRQAEVELREKIEGVLLNIKVYREDKKAIIVRMKQLILEQKEKEVEGEENV